GATANRPASPSADTAATPQQPAAATPAAQADAAPQGAQANAALPAEAGAASPKRTDPCALLTADDIKSVQGEAATQIKPSRQEGAEFSVSQCFYQTPTFTKSVSLELTERGASRKSVREFWKERVAGYEERREAKNERREKSGKPLAGPASTPVKGVGDEAYWIGTSANGTLYAFKKDALVRVSIGGPDKEAERLRKVKALAQKALARL
ncbi:MAG TPA: hypothetical protein VK421_06595, partial [Pyrinomonadaceae bacterium]|nr:hypothetical protein [Pyrinomonadaceae bacterium]